jgi:putrescine transport system ATP-binding protein
VRIAVDDGSLTVERGTLFALLEPSGCGKTTLLRMITGFETPEHGHIFIDGVDVTALPPYARPVNMMFQSYALFPHMDVAANIAFGLRQEGRDRRRAALRVGEMPALVQMSIMAGVARMNCRAVSASAFPWRALAKMPKLLLLDEPLAAPTANYAPRPGSS